jgi:signal transduction histidine kinase
MPTYNPMNRLVQQFLSPPKPVVVVLAWGLMFLIGSMDYITGRDFAVSPYYLVPICWASWAAGRRVGTWLAIASTVTWFVSDLMSGYVYQHTLTPVWNALMFLILFLFVVHLISAFQTAHYHLEDTVQQRTAALQAEIQERKKLEAAKIQAERLAMVGTMAAQVAHEIRNPLGSITFNLDLIHREIDSLTQVGGHPPGEARTLVNEMRAEVRRIQRVIEDYLQFARLPKLQKQPVNLNAFLEKKLAFYGSELARENVKLRTHFDPALPTINADAEQIWQALLNLIRNSRQAMPDGGELTIGTWRDGGRVLLRITDNGKGMTEEQLKQLFVPFFTTKKEGTGLGLALVQQIVTEHGGHVECESTSGQGSTFTLFLPLTEKS